MNGKLLTGELIQELNVEFGLLSSTDNQIPEEPSVPECTQCPLCPDHKDYDFVWSTFLSTHICHGCSYDIYNGLYGWAEKPTEENYNHSDTIDHLMEQTGLSFQQLKFKYLLDDFELGTSFKPPFAKGIMFQDIHDSELNNLNMQLDDEIGKILEIRNQKTKIEAEGVFDNLVFKDISKSIKESNY